MNKLNTFLLNIDLEKKKKLCMKKKKKKFIVMLGICGDPI